MKDALRTLIALFVGIPLTAVEVEGQSPTAWMARPEIREIRDIYAEVTEAIRIRELTEDVRQFEYCQPSVTYRAVAADEDGNIRRYVEKGGSDDSAFEAQYFYDTAGHLRFIFAKRGAVNGSRLEEREYYGAQGDSLYVDRRIVEGIGYFWVDPDPILDPRAAFDAPGECPEKP